MKLVLSADRNWAIGKNGGLLFPMAPDMRRFREMTSGGAVIMGRKTFESLPNGKPLKSRLNIVLTRDQSCKGDGERLLFCRSLDELSLFVKELGQVREKIWVIGGGEIYRLLMPYSEEALVTRIDAFASGADCWMEDLDKTDGWSLEEEGHPQQWGGLRFQYIRYVNKNAQKIVNITS